LQSAGVADTTDDTGAFRVYGLLPGDYYVAATPRRVEDRTGRPVPGTILGRGTPIFFPGTANRDEAQRVTVDVGSEARADLVLTPVRTSKVSGIVLTSSGIPAAGAMVSLLSRDMSLGGNDGADALVPLQIRDDADANGRFELEGVPPGSFTLRVNTRPGISVPFDPVTQRFTAPPVLPPMETAAVPVNIDGDISGLTLTTSAGGTIDVVVVADQGVSGTPPDNVRILARGMDGNSTSLMISEHVGSDTVSISASALTLSSSSLGVRTTLGVQGPSRLSVEGLPAGWTVKAILLENEDVTDRSIELRDAQAKTLRVVLTDRVTGAVGSITAPSFGDTTASQAIVLMFADNEKKWAYPSRFIRTLRADRGRFEVTGLPPNEEYRAVAVDFLDDGEEYDPDFLKKMRERAVRFSLREGERIALDLRLVQR